MNKILSLPIRRVHKKFKDGEVRPSEVCKAASNLAVALKPLNPYTNITSELTKRRSEESDRRYANGESLGDLDGIPIAIKDNFCVAGERTSCASLMLENFVPGYDATVYARLANLGATLIGKTNLDEFAMGSGSVESHFGETKNLWGSDLFRSHYENGVVAVAEERERGEWFVAGGSSGGSAVAVATNSCYAALGSDSGGSTRNPASYCGLVGLKPSYGLVSRHGLVPLVDSMDAPGIIARNVEDTALILNAIAGPDPADSTTLGSAHAPAVVPSARPSSLGGLRVGIPREYRPPGLTDRVSDCWARTSDLLEEAGASVVPVSLPHTEWSVLCYSVLNQCEVASNMARYDGIRFGFRADESSSTERLFGSTRSRGFGDVVRARIFTGNYFLLANNCDEYLTKAMKIRRLICQDFDSVWESNVDALLTPTTLSEAPSYAEYAKTTDDRTRCATQDFCTQPANMAGIPAISVPVAISPKGLPLSLQLMAPYLHETRLLELAKWIEDAVQFPRPTLVDSTPLLLEQRSNEPFAQN